MIDEHKHPQPDRRRARLVPVVAGLLLSGCASITAVQRPIVARDLTNHVCPSQAQLEATPTAPEQRGAYRDRIVLACVKAINAQFAAFKTALHRESTGANLLTDIASQTLATFAAVETGGTANGLAASSALVTGAGQAFNKNVFFDVALPAIEAAMDAVRARVLTAIVDAQNADPDALRYSLARAGYDLDTLQAAGSLYAGLSELTRVARDAATNEQAELAESQQGRISGVRTATLLQDDVFTRTKAITDKVLALTPAADAARVDKLAALLGVAVQATDTFDTRKANVLVAIVDSVSVGDPAKQIAAIAALEAKLKPELP